MIAKICSGGQSGVDRAALDIARFLGVPIGGWCPKNGWAEDFPDSPGLTSEYPELKETKSERIEQRTVFNVRDSDATLILRDKSISKGTDLTQRACKAFGKPYLIVDVNDVNTIAMWFSSFSIFLILNIAGPRESESPGIYERTYKTLLFVLPKHVATRRSRPTDLVLRRNGLAGVQG
jgi:hypothetical protein